MNHAASSRLPDIDLSAAQRSPYVERPTIPPGMTIADYRCHQEERPAGTWRKVAMAALFPLRFYAHLTEQKIYS